jgi:general secretion pathway protein B
MSFILDALKKSENDRQRQSAPALFEVKVAAPRQRFPYWAVGLAVLLGVNLLALAWMLLRKPSAPEVASSAAPAAAPGPARAGDAAQSGTMVTLPATVTVTIPSSSGVSVSSGAPEPGVVAPSEAPPLAEEPMLSGNEPSVPPDYDLRDYEPAVTPAQAGAAAAAAARSGVPSRDEVLARGTQLPELRMDLHVYDADPAARFVFINMRKLREGDSLPDGVRVEEITPRGARLSFRGTQFTVDGN